MDSDRAHCRRCSRSSKQLKHIAAMLALDKYVLGRMCDFVCHILRQCVRNPGPLTGQDIRHRDALWKETMTALQGIRDMPIELGAAVP